MNKKSFMCPPSNIPPYKAVTERILGICEKPDPNVRQEDPNLPRSSPKTLHSPPFWWNMSPQSSKPWECWSMEDFNFRNCKWEGCYRPCVCQQKEDEPLNCRYPNFCGYHTNESIISDENERKACPGQIATKKDSCCFCIMKKNVLNGADNRKIPDPRCTGQYHLSLLEKILGRGTALAISKTREDYIDDENCTRGYIPGDIHRKRSWSGCIGGDPMCEEYYNGIFPKEVCPYDMGLTHEAETWDNGIKEQYENNQ